MPRSGLCHWMDRHLSYHCYHLARAILPAPRTVPQALFGLPATSQAVQVFHGTFDAVHLERGYAEVLCLRRPGDSGYARSSRCEFKPNCWDKNLAKDPQGLLFIHAS